MTTPMMRPSPCTLRPSSKDAFGSYDVEHEWDVYKSVNPSSQSAFYGETKNFSWTVRVNEKSTSKNYEVTGEITIVNPNPDDTMTLTLTDVLNDGTVATIGPCINGTLVGNELTVAAGRTATCKYQATPSGMTYLETWAPSLPCCPIPLR